MSAHERGIWTAATDHIPAHAVRTKRRHMSIAIVKYSSSLCEVLYFA